MPPTLLGSGLPLGIQLLPKVTDLILQRGDKLRLGAWYDVGRLVRLRRTIAQQHEQGSRHDYVLAATGLVGRNLPRWRAERVMEAAIEASDDEEAHQRLRDVVSTLDNLEAGNAVTGGPTLEQLAPGVYGQLCRWHGWNKRKDTNRSGDGGPMKRSAKDDDDPPTDDELRDRFILANADYAYGLGQWRRYEDGIWPAVPDFKVERGVCEVLEAAKPEKVRPTLSRVNSVANLARIKLAVEDELWDANPDILVCKNGAVDLTTGELLPHSREHYALAAVDYDYDPGAESLAWARVMVEVVKAHLGADAVSFLQEFAGYSITSACELETALWLHGEKGGGRSTILAGLMAMLGPKAGVLSLSDIERSNFALTNLPGKTLVTATEQPGTFLRGGGTLNAIISGEPVQVDRKYRDPVTITPTAKIAWAMNELPRVGNLSDGIFRRIKIMTLPEIAPEDRDPQVKEDVKKSGAAILNWALEGLKRLRERGHFVIPDTIQEATRQFQETNDVPGLFVEEMCERNALFEVGASELYRAYKYWCDDHGHKPQSSTTLARDWERLGFGKKHTRAGNVWTGLKLKGRP